MRRAATANDLEGLLSSLDPQAHLAHRHLWLIHLLEWVRGRRDSVPAAVGRVQLFLDAVQSRPDVQVRLQAWWTTLVDQVDITTLLADFGFAPPIDFRARNQRQAPGAGACRHGAAAPPAAAPQLPNW